MSRLAIRKGVVVVAARLSPESEAAGVGEVHPRPDSRKMEDLTGSLLADIVVGEFEVTRRSRSGVSARGCSLWVLIVRRRQRRARRGTCRRGREKEYEGEGGKSSTTESQIM